MIHRSGDAAFCTEGSLQAKLSPWPVQDAAQGEELMSPKQLQHIRRLLESSAAADRAAGDC